MTLLELVAKLSLDTSEYEKAIGSAKQSASGLADSVRNSFSGIGSGTGAAAQNIEKIGQSGEQAAAGLDKATKAADATTEAAGGLGGQLSGLAGTFGMTLTAAGIAKLEFDALKYAVTQSHDAFAEFESAFTGVFKTVEGTPEQLAAIEQGIKDMSGAIPSTVEEIAGVAEAAGQLGIATDDVLSFTEIMIDLGNATNLSADEAATALARLSNIMGVQASEYSSLGSAIVGLGNNFATTESEIVSMATRMASTAAVIGLSTQEVLGLATAMSSLGIEAEAGGSAASKVLKDIQSAVSNGGPKLEKFAEAAGMTAGAFSTLWDSSPMEAFEAFIDGLAGISEEGGDALSVLADLEINEVRTSNAILALANGHEMLADALSESNSAWAENNALAEEAEKRYDTLASKEAMAQNSWKRMWAAIGGQYEGIFKGIATGANWLWTTIAKGYEYSNKNMKEAKEWAYSQTKKGKAERLEKEQHENAQKLRDDMERHLGEEFWEIEVTVTLEPEFRTPTLSEKATAAREEMLEQLYAEMGYTGQRMNKEGQLEDFDDSAKWWNKVAENAGKMTNAFGALNTGAKENVLTFEDLLGNLNANSEAMQSWGDNMQDLNSRMKDFNGGDIILEQLRNMGIEGAEQVAAMVDMTDEQLRQLAESAAYSADIALTVTMQVEGAEDAEIALQQELDTIQQQVDDYTKLFQAGLITEEQFKDLTAPLEEQLRALTDAAGLTSSAVVEELKNAQGAAEGEVQAFETVGQEIVATMAAGVEANGIVLSGAISGVIRAALAKYKSELGYTQEGPQPKGRAAGGMTGIPSTIGDGTLNGVTIVQNIEAPGASPSEVQDAAVRAYNDLLYTSVSGR